MARREAPLVYIDTSEWVAFKKVLDQDKFGKSLARALRRRVKEIGQVAIDKVKAKLDEPTPGGNAPGEGLNAIASTVKQSISFTEKNAGVKITASARALPAAHKGLLNVYNLGQFKNPEERTGKGNPYFGAVIYNAVDKNMIAEIRAALRTATDAIGARGE